MAKEMISVKAYAKKCGVSKTVIFKRITNGELGAERNIDGIYFIPANTKPVKAKKGGRPFATFS